MLVYNTNMKTRGQEWKLERCSLKQLTQGTCSFIIPNTQTEETNMATLDIRTGTNLTIDEILFQKSSESNSLSSIKQSPNKYTKSVFFKNCKGDLVGFVDMDDIDNLILALQKAKELWSK